MQNELSTLPHLKVERSCYGQDYNVKAILPIANLAPESPFLKAYEEPVEVITIYIYISQAYKYIPIVHLLNTLFILTIYEFSKTRLDYLFTPSLTSAS